MKFLFTLLALLIPSVSFAQDSGWIDGMLDLIAGVVAGLLPIVIGIAVLTFIWGLVKYITAKDPEKQKEARGIIIWGIIILFVIVALWGIVSVLGETLGIGPNNNQFDPPSIPGYN